ncbi:hypothetical protein C3V36_04450 [Lachnospiraceae bacterium oral taxon 500]|nr:hypothetical protein C3V36_04450 [Lachnospiraceae bacterium oral taxon 500]
MRYGVKNGKGGFLIPDSRPGHETDEAVIEEDASGSNPQQEGQGVWTPPDNKSVYKKGTLVRAEHPDFSEKVPRLQWHIRMNYLNEKMRLEGTAGFERHNVLLEDELQDPEMEIDTRLGVVFVGRVRLMTPDNKASWHVMFYPSYRELSFFPHIPGESYDSFKTRLTQTPISSRPRVGIYPGDGTTGSKLLIYFGDLDNNSPFTYDQFPSNLKADIITKLNELEAAGQITAVQRTNTLNAYKVNDLKMAPVWDYTIQFYTKQNTNKAYPNKASLYWNENGSTPDTSETLLEYRDASGSAQLDISLQISKHWRLGEGNLPTGQTVTVNIYDSRDTDFAYPVRQNIRLVGSRTIDDLPKYDRSGRFPAGVPVQYVVVEKTAAGEDAAKYMPKYQYDYSNPDEQKATITNYGTKEFFVRKFWENTGQTVPVWVVLKADGVLVSDGRKQLTAPDWRVSFGRHKLYDDHNRKINYTIEEEVPAGYQPVPKIEETLEGFSVTNTPLPPTTPYEPPTPETPPEPAKPPVTPPTPPEPSTPPEPYIPPEPVTPPAPPTPPTPPIPEVPFDDELPRDVPEVELPKTDGVPAMVFFGAGLGLVGIGIFLKKRKK